MRWWLPLLILCACTIHTRLPKPGEVAIHVKTSVRVEARTPPPPEAQVIVPIQGAQVVEFFGIPLEGAQDVVFVLDCSGSMADPVSGRMAEIQVAPQSTQPTTPPPPPSGPPGPPPPPPYGPPPPSSAEPPPSPDPNAPTDVPGSTTVVSTPTVRKIDVAQAELVAALERLPAGTRMNVLFFNTAFEAFTPTLAPLDDVNRPNMIGFVKTTEPANATALITAMRIAFLMNAKRIVLLSDGLGNVGGGADRLLRDAREAIRGGVRIDAIGIGLDQDAYLMETLARESGGLYQPL